MQKTVTECDMCGKIKGETNHWFSVFISTRPDPTKTKGFTCTPGINTSESMHHACGQACAIKFLQRFLSNGTLEADIIKEETPSVDFERDSSCA